MWVEDFFCKSGHNTLLERKQWNPNDNYEKPMKIISLVDHIPWNTHGKPGKFSWPMNEWIFMGTTHEKIHENPWNYTYENAW